MNDTRFSYPVLRPDSAQLLQDRGRAIIAQEAEALRHLGEGLDDGFARACLLIARARRLVVSGMGKSGHIGRKIAASFAATGTPALFLHPAEASHGDLGMMMAGDLLLVLSNSGNTAELAPVMRHACALGMPIVGIAGRAQSMVGKMADVLLLLPDRPEVCEGSFAPTTSTVMQLSLGDALALCVMEEKGVSRGQIRALHPGGAIGLRLTPVSELMHDAGLPLVAPDMPMRDVLSVITDHRYGLAGVVDAGGRLLGVISDGDLRRHFAVLADCRAGDVMTRHPLSLKADVVAVDALQRMNEAKITAAFVVAPMADGGVMPIGIVHMHDLLQMGLGGPDEA